MLSNTSRYAIRALIYLAINNNEKNKIGIKKIANDLDIPSPFLGKILQTLVKKKVLYSIKGPNGGFYMPHQLQSTTLYDIIQIIDGDDLFEKCLVSDKHCAEFDENPCTLHIHYEEIRKELKKMFSEHTIENLAREFKNSGKKIDL